MLACNGIAIIISTRSYLQDWRVSGNRPTWEKSDPKIRRAVEERIASKFVLGVTFNDVQSQRGSKNSWSQRKNHNYKHQSSKASPV